MSQGIIYCLSNPSYEDIFKNGFIRKTLKQRLQSLYTTGVVYPFKVKFAKNVEDCIDCENVLDYMLSKFRINKYREFFKIVLIKIIDLFYLLEWEYCVISVDDSDEVNNTIVEKVKEQGNSINDFKNDILEEQVKKDK